MICALIILSNILQRFDVSEIGRKLAGFDALHPGLRMGIIWEYLKLVGTCDSSRLFLYRKNRGMFNASLVPLSSLAHIPSGPGAVSPFIPTMASIIFVGVSRI